MFPRSVAVPVALVSLAALTACPMRDDGAFDLSAVGPGRYGEPYSAQVHVEAYDGPVRYTQVGGELPAGLDMTASGQISGIPEFAGLFTITVRASDMRSVEDFQGDLSIEILANHLDDAFVGFERPYLNNFYFDEGGKMADLWMRVTGVGIEGMNSQTLDVGIYLPGSNGRNEGGAGDDVRIGVLPVSEVDIEVGEYRYVDEVDPAGPSYPSGHYNEDDPVVYDAETGTFTAGADTGRMSVEISHRDYGVVETRAMVVPPDWCPAGIAWTVCE